MLLEYKKEYIDEQGFVVNYDMKNLLLLLMFVSMIFAIDRGKLVSFEILESLTQNQAQSEIDDDIAELGIEANYDITIYKIIYETLDGYGDSITASGVIAFPEDIEGAFPMISWQHGTQVRRNSVQSINGFDLLSIVLSSNGYVYIAPDYVGLGLSYGLHPYMIKSTTSSSVIDMIRAAREFCSNMNLVQNNSQLMLVGYSEGGYATLAAQQTMEQELSDEFDITVSFPMAGPYDLSGTMADVMLSAEEYGAPHYLPYVLLSYIEYYDLGELNDFFLPEYAELLPELFNGEYSSGSIDEQIPNPPIDMLHQSVVSDFSNNPDNELRNLLIQNNLLDWTPYSLTYIFHGEADELVPYLNSQIAYENFINNGADPNNVIFETIPASAGGHQDVALIALQGAFEISNTIQTINYKGDLDENLSLNISDIVMLIANVLNNNDTSSYIKWAGDIDNNEQINILDVILLINVILSE